MNDSVSLVISPCYSKQKRVNSFFKGQEMTPEGEDNDIPSKHQEPLLQQAASQPPTDQDPG